MRHIPITRRGIARMSEIAHITRNRKLQDALGGIPPARHQLEFAGAVAADKERRAELRNKFDELATDELERLWSLSGQRGSVAKIETGQ
jgi:hypothetical protein